LVYVIWQKILATSCKPKPTVHILEKMRVIRFCAAILAALLCTVARADTVSVTAPPYWTGTYNEVTGTAIGGPYVEALMRLNGEVTKHWVFEAPAMQHLTMALTVDSTHFETGSTVEISYELKRLDGQWVEGSGSVPVQNSAWSWEYPDFIGITGGHSSEIVRS
jgi:hypothetical protein